MLLFHGLVVHAACVYGSQLKSVAFLETALGDHGLLTIASKLTESGRCGAAVPPAVWRKDIIP